MSLKTSIIKLIELGFIPDSIIRKIIKLLLKSRLKIVTKNISNQNKNSNLLDFKNSLNNFDIALATNEANEQHYENPVELFKLFMGDYLKYSCGYWYDNKTNLSESELSMLELYVERAKLQDGQQILELGCGWGSLSLWLAKKFPSSKITAVSNSRDQKHFIDSFNYSNLEVITIDMNNFFSNKKYDRIISIEMFEHMRNWNELLKRISNWLYPNGLVFIHIFTHRNKSYFLDGNEKVNWMAKYFFNQGMIPSTDLMPLCDDYLSTKNIWKVNGNHYAKTLKAWLHNFDYNKKRAIRILSSDYYDENPVILFQRWRIFFMACEELFKFNKGSEWFVTHYLLEKK